MGLRGFDVFGNSTQTHPPLPLQKTWENFAKQAWTSTVSRFCFLDVPGDEVVVHEEEAHSNEVECDVHAMAEPHGFVVGGSKSTHGGLLPVTHKKV